MRRIFLPSFPAVFFLSVFLVTSLLFGAKLLNDADTGYHIRAGEHMLKTLSVPTEDIFSYRSPPVPWTSHEWLSEVLMALSHKAFGLAGVVVMFSLVLALTYAFLFSSLLSASRDVYASLFVMALVVGASMIHWLARPHVFSLLLFALCYQILNDYQSEKSNRLLYLPLLMVLWVNLHGGYISAFMLLGIFMSDSLVRFVFGERERRDFHRKRGIRLLLAALACLLATLVNPHGPGILLFPFRLTGNRYIMDRVNEWLSPNFHHAMVFTPYLLLVLFLALVARRKLVFREAALVVFFTYMALYSVRYVPLFAIICAPIVLVLMRSSAFRPAERLLAATERRSAGLLEMNASAGSHLWPLVSICLALSLAYTGRLSARFDPGSKPVKAVEFLLSEHVGGNMFNNDEFGDYLIYAAWPKYRVFFDGRSDMYGNEAIREYYQVINLGPEFDAVLGRHRISWIFYNTRSPLASYLMAREEWKLIYSDPLASIFVRDEEGNRELIEKYRPTRLASGEDSSET